MRWFYIFARSVTWFIFTVMYDISYENVENIPQNKGGYISACNHVKYLDPLMVAFKQKQWIRYMGKVELHNIQGLGWLFRWLGSIAVERGTGDMSAIDKCVEIINDGGIIGIFPEGTRYPVGQPGRPKSGMALIAKMTKADVLPCAVVYDQPFKLRSKVTVKYGKLIPYDELGLDDDSPRALKRATKRIWGDILELLGVGEGKDEQ